MKFDIKKAFSMRRLSHYGGLGLGATASRYTLSPKIISRVFKKNPENVKYAAGVPILLGLAANAFDIPFVKSFGDGLISDGLGRVGARLIDPKNEAGLQGMSGMVMMNGTQGPVMMNEHTSEQLPANEVPSYSSNYSNEMAY